MNLVNNYIVYVCIATTMKKFNLPFVKIKIYYISDSNHLVSSFLQLNGKFMYIHLIKAISTCCFQAIWFMRFQ